MKKFIVLFMAVFVTSTTVVAQKSAEYGFLTGVNLNNAKGKNFIPAENLGTYVGKSFGGFYKQNFTEKFGLKVLLQYDQNGYKIKNLVFESGTGITIRNTYLNIPVLAEYSFGKKIKVALNAGPYVGLQLGSHILYNKNFVDIFGNEQPRKQKSESFKNINIGFSAGANLSAPLTKKMLFHFSVQNHFGVSTIFKETSNNSTARLNAFSILAGVGFKL